MTNPSQPGTTPNPDGSTPTAPGGQATPTPAPAAPTGGDFDPTKLSGDQISKVLENQDVWKSPRLQELLASQKELAALKKNQETQTEATLAEQKKFEELAEKRRLDLETSQNQIQTLRIDQALTNDLVKENVVDLDGALKLVDRSKLSVDDNGQVSGLSDALASLKTDRAYLFASGDGKPTNPQLGNPSNPTGGGAAGSGQFKFKESQLTPEFYAANKAEIDQAGRLGLIEPDGPPR